MDGHLDGERRARLLRELAAGANNSAAARASGYSRQHVIRLQKDPGFLAELERLRDVVSGELNPDAGELEDQDASELEEAATDFALAAGAEDLLPAKEGAREVDQSVQARVTRSLDALELVRDYATKAKDRVAAAKEILRFCERAAAKQALAQIEAQRRTKAEALREVHTAAEVRDTRPSESLEDARALIG